MVIYTMRRALQGTQLLAAVVFVGATIVLAIQLINPSPVVVSVGENGADVAELGGYFRYRDVGVVAVAASLLGASGSYLLLAERPTPDATSVEDGSPSPPSSSDGRTDDNERSDELLEARRREWEETADRLADNERVIYRTVLEADGVLAQNEIVDRTDLSKATVSRVLDSLETKDLVERKRRGMGNVVLLL